MNSILLAYFLHQVTLPRNLTVIPRQDTVLEETEKRLTVTQMASGVYSFPAGSQRVQLLNLLATASCAGDVTIDGIQFRHKGLGSVQDIESVYLLKGNRRLLRGRNVQRDGTVNLNFSPINISACDTVAFTLAADFSSQASVAGEHMFTLENASNISSNAIVTLNTETDSNPKKPVVTGSAPLGKINVTYPKLLRSVRYGEDQTIARIKLEADGKSHHEIHAITLTNLGSATYEDIQNIYLDTGRNQRVSEIVKSLDGDKVRLTFNPAFIVEKNQIRLLTLKADVLVGRSRTLKFVIEETSDIEASEIQGRRNDI